MNIEITNLRSFNKDLKIEEVIKVIHAKQITPWMIDISIHFPLHSYMNTDIMNIDEEKYEVHIKLIDFNLWRSTGQIN